MVASQQERQQVEAVIRGWMAGFAAMDMDRVKAVWDKDYPQLIYIPEESDDHMTGWASINAYYDSLVGMVESVEWTMDNLTVDVIGNAAYAYHTFYVKAKVKGMDNTMIANGRNTFVLRRTGGGWKIIHYHESLSRDRSHEMWAFLWA